MIRDQGDDERLYCMSAGLAVENDAPAAKNAVDVCREIGVDITRHRARGITDIGDISAFDLFAAMTPTQAYVLRQAGVPEDRVCVLGDGIPDPFGGDEETYRRCRDSIQRALDALYPLLRARCGT